MYFHLYLEYFSRFFVFFTFFHFISCGEGINGLGSSASSSLSVVPAGVVQAFNLSSCPSGWNVYSSAAGRGLLGVGSGNLDGDSLDLTSRSLNDTGGIEYTTALPLYLFGGAEDESSPNGSNLCLAGTIWAGTTDTTIAGDKEDSNMMPFISYLYCEKDSSSTSSIPAQSIVAHSSSCEGDWAEDTSSRGRIHIGVGSGGNTDKDGVVLTSRILLSTGGREYTTGIPAYSGAATTTDPSNGYLAAVAALYASGYTSGNVLGDHVVADSNMAPYYVVNFCKLNSVSSNTYSSGTVLAFDLSSCPSGWSAFEDGKGRFLLGAGSGNLDAGSDLLTARINGASGGYEKTRIGLRVSSAVGGNTPSPTRYLTNNGDDIYTSSSANGYTHTSVDSNLPPFVALLYCVKD